LYFLGTRYNAIYFNFFGGFGVSTQGLALTRHVLYYLSQVPSPFLLYFQTGFYAFALADLKLQSFYLWNYSHEPQLLALPMPFEFAQSDFRKKGGFQKYFYHSCIALVSKLEGQPHTETMAYL
jgi:hypothetical protein